MLESRDSLSSSLNTCLFMASRCLNVGESSRPLAPTVVRNAARHSKASSLSGFVSSSCVTANITWLATMFLASSAPTKRMLPSMAVLYFTSASTFSSPCRSLRCSGGFKYRSKEFWHSFSRMRLKLPLSVSPTSFSAAHLCMSTQRSVYMAMKWCCVVAFSMISCMRISRCSCVEIPHSISCCRRGLNFSSVSLFSTDLIRRGMTLSSTGPSPLSVASLCLRCCAAQELEETSSGTTGSRTKSSSRRPRMLLPPLEFGVIRLLPPRRFPLSGERRMSLRLFLVEAGLGPASTGPVSKFELAMRCTSLGLATSPSASRHLSNADMSRATTSRALSCGPKPPSSDILPPGFSPPPTPPPGRMPMPAGLRLMPPVRLPPGVALEEAEAAGLDAGGLSSSSPSLSSARWPEATEPKEPPSSSEGSSSVCSTSPFRPVPEESAVSMSSMARCSDCSPHADWPGARAGAAATASSPRALRLGRAAALAAAPDSCHSSSSQPSPSSWAASAAGAASSAAASSSSASSAGAASSAASSHSSSSSSSSRTSASAAGRAVSRGDLSDAWASKCSSASSVSTSWASSAAVCASSSSPSSSAAATSSGAAS
mmetsp:Transcript_49140/g.126728  ORF Transcript_49140/g.126728 Transcript_49140/m.126728 type:complete len:599 (+) Transcript_49140:305-2101(+)